MQSAAPAVRNFPCATLVITIHVLLSIAVVNEYRMFNIHAGLISYDCTEDIGDNDSNYYDGSGGGDDRDCDGVDDCEGAF